MCRWSFSTSSSHCRKAGCLRTSNEAGESPPWHFRKWHERLPGVWSFLSSTLIVVTVERIECISIVHHDIEQRTAVLGQPLLILDSTSQHLDQLAEFIELLAGYALIDGITLKQVLFQYLIGPNAESGCIF